MSSIMRWQSRSIVVVSVMVAILGEVANTSILRTGLPISQLATDLSALASRAAGCRVATLCHGTSATSRSLALSPIMGHERTKDRTWLTSLLIKAAIHEFGNRCPRACYSQYEGGI